MAVTLARWCIAAIKEMRRHRQARGQDKEAQAVAKQLALARQKLAPLYPSLEPASATGQGRERVHAAAEVVARLRWGIDDSAPAVASLWSSLETDLGRVIKGLVSDTLLWSALSHCLLTRSPTYCCACLRVLTHLPSDCPLWTRCSAV